MQIEEKPIEAVHDNNLREWLHQPMFDTLIEVLASRVFAKEAQSANELTKWDGGKFPEYQSAALKTAGDCAEISRTIEILKELREQRESYSKFTAIPT